MILFWLAIASKAKNSMFNSIIALSILTLIRLTNLNSINLLPATITRMFQGNSFNTAIISLTLFVVIIILLVRVKYQYQINRRLGFTLANLTLILICTLFFITDNLLFFYITFEASLIPTLILLLKWGYQPERLIAGTYFIIYTISASLPLLFIIIKIYNDLSSLKIDMTYPCLRWSIEIKSHLLFVSLIIAFLVKVPIWGVHLWLPKAHVEAPVRGSIILAGILLKLGGYGLIKIYIYSNQCFNTLVNFILSINIWGVIAISMVCIRQTDIKKLIAYSSVIHIGLIIIGILSYSYVGWIGAIIMMIAHGISSPGIFSIANFNYEITNSRIILIQKGLINLYPISALFWFILLAANMAAPPSLNLAGELLICIRALKIRFFTFTALIARTLLAASYNLFLYARQTGSVNNMVRERYGIKSNIILARVMHTTPLYFLTLTLSAIKL